jgi:archaellum component FlaC
MHRSVGKMKKSFLLSVAVIIGCSFLLSACGIGVAETDITVYKDKYKLVTVISISPEQMRMIGSPGVFESALEEEVLDARKEGINIKWRDLTKKDGSVYQYEVSTGLIDISNPYADNFSWQEIRYENRDAYEFRYSMFSGLFSGFQSLTLTLHAGQILDSNGTQLDARTVTWVNPMVTPYAVVTPKGSATWLPLLLVFGLITAVGYISYQLIKSGKLVEWSTTVFNVGKWKVQEAKLNGEIKTLEKDKADLINELGAKAWKARVVDPKYDEPYGKLEAFDHQVSEIDREIATLNLELDETRNTHLKIESDYAEQLSHFQNELKNVNANLEKSRKEQSTLEKELSHIEREKERLTSEIQGYERKLTQIEISDAEDKENQIPALTSAISTLNKNLVGLTEKTPALHDEIEISRIEQQPLFEQVDSLNNQINQTKNDQKIALEPLTQQRKQLESKIQALKSEVNNLQQQMKTIINSLGPLVDSARPESEILQSNYEQIDRKNVELEGKNEENNLIKARLGLRDKDAIRNFLLMVLGTIVAIVLIVLLLSMAL